MFTGVLTPPDQNLAATLRRLRQQRGITQEALAFRAHVTVSALSRIERGLSNPVWTTLVRLADALDVTPAELAAAAEDNAERARGGER
ncbi:MAG TPA: helix-turn-helix transcriptional regulator [Solirubrobacteraceae bacterium]|jgi:transcriptional regulator with XRE-family HTH domain